MAGNFLLEEAVGNVGPTQCPSFFFSTLFDRAHLLGVDDEIAQHRIKCAPPHSGPPPLPGKRAIWLSMVMGENGTLSWMWWLAISFSQKSCSSA